MQLQGILLIFFLAVFLPITILSSNQDAFFLILSIILSVLAIKNIYVNFFDKSIEELSEDNDDEVNELEDLLGMDVKKLAKGFNVALTMVTVLYFMYCIFFLHALFVKIVIYLIIIFHIHGIVIYLKGSENRKGLVFRVWMLAVYSGTLLVTVTVALNKYMGFLI